MQQLISRYKPSRNTFASWISAWALTTTGIFSPTLLQAASDRQLEMQGPVDSQKPIVDAALLRILNDTGIVQQLNTVAPVAIDESKEHWQGCDSYPASIEPWINEAFSLDEMTQIALSALQNSLDASLVTEIILWLNSEAGKSITEAERESASLSTFELNRLIRELNTMPDKQRERAPRIRAIVKNTRAAEFVTLMNTELNAIVSLASECQSTNKSVQKILSKASVERGNTELLKAIMSEDLQAPTTVIFRKVSNTILEKYLEFTNSPTGEAYHAALISVTRNTLINRLETFARWRMEQL